MTAATLAFPSMSDSVSDADRLVARLALEIEDGAVVATGVASPLAILAIGVAQRTHAPQLTYIACVGSLNPQVTRLHRSSEDLAYLHGRTGEVSIPELFDHARRGRIDTIFFGAAEVDGLGRTNLTAAGTLRAPRIKFPGVAGACSLRRWCRHPVLLVPRQERRNLVAHVQVVSTQDDARRTRLLTDLATFEVGPGGATLQGTSDGVALETVRARTGFTFDVPPLRDTARAPAPDVTPEMLVAIRALDPDGLRHALVGRPPLREEIPASTRNDLV